MSALSLGIIGGADGPTAVFVSGPAGGLPLAGLLLLAAALLALGLGLFLWWRKRKEK